ncbi:antitoxin [Arthrobacter sp. NEB 688]|uniref:antitoxin n=1 Tax=Arthrobacter sp. NEB 688 TaxID=904039 RepID=UPI0015633CE8|nr:antitoxin [Arthrobacter sp. NEB 688]QKE85587.1 antitoxin [Arthrobacter sp. NEB 688]
MAKGRAAALIAAVTKVKDYARNNPQKADDAIGKVEGFVRSKTGPTHSAKVDKGGDALRKGLGLPPHGTSGGRAAGGQVPPPPPPSAGPTH